MADYAQRAETNVAERTFFTQVYGWMAAALAVTGFMALAVTRSAAMQRFIFGNPLVFYGLIIGELVLVMVLVSRLNRMSAQTATTVFVVYALVNGLTLSAVFLAYTSATIARAFFVTAGMFAVMTVVGFTTKIDLTKLGSLLFMALLGFIIASLVNLFLQSEALYWIITYVGVVIFVGLIAFDTQRIKAMANAGFSGEETERKGAIFGALRLYLDFINLFLMLLRIFGRR